MKINVAQQLKGPLGNTRHYVVDETTRDGFCVQGDIKLVLTDRSILVTGAMQTIVRNTCSRCLEEFDYSLGFEIEEEYFPTRDIFSSIPVSKCGDEDGFIIGEDHILDLAEAMRQGILLNLPTKPVCRSECAGLCQGCGYNLNYNSCHCSEEQLDHRWAPLRGLISTEMIR